MSETGSLPLRVSAPRPRIHVVGLVLGFDNRILIRGPGAVIDHAGSSGPAEVSSQMEPVWDFPRGWVMSAESPEAAMRRICQSLVGLSVEIDIGQPPLEATVDSERAELRYFFCGATGAPRDVREPADCRWVTLEELSVLPMHPMHQPVVAWLIDQERS